MFWIQLFSLFFIPTLVLCESATIIGKPKSPVATSSSEPNKVVVSNGHVAKISGTSEFTSTERGTIKITASKRFKMEDKTEIYAEGGMIALHSKIVHLKKFAALRCIKDYIDSNIKLTTCKIEMNGPRLALGERASIQGCQGTHLKSRGNLTIGDNGQIEMILPQPLKRTSRGPRSQLTIEKQANLVIGESSVMTIENRDNSLAAQSTLVIGPGLVVSGTRISVGKAISVHLFAGDQEPDDSASTIISCSRKVVVTQKYGMTTPVKVNLDADVSKGWIDYNIHMKLLLEPAPDQIGGVRVIGKFTFPGCHIETDESSVVDTGILHLNYGKVVALRNSSVRGDISLICTHPNMACRIVVKKYSLLIAADYLFLRNVQIDIKGDDSNPSYMIIGLSDIGEFSRILIKTGCLAKIDGRLILGTHVDFIMLANSLVLIQGPGSFLELGSQTTLTVVTGTIKLEGRAGLIVGRKVRISVRTATLVEAGLKIFESNVPEFASWRSGRPEELILSCANKVELSRNSGAKSEEPIEVWALVKRDIPDWQVLRFNVSFFPRDQKLKAKFEFPGCYVEVDESSVYPLKLLHLNYGKLIVLDGSTVKGINSLNCTEPGDHCGIKVMNQSTLTSQEPASLRNALIDIRNSTKQSVEVKSLIMGELSNLTLHGGSSLKVEGPLLLGAHAQVVLTNADFSLTSYFEVGRGSLIQIRDFDGSNIGTSAGLSIGPDKDILITKILNPGCSLNLFSERKPEPGDACLISVGNTLDLRGKLVDSKAEISYDLHTENVSNKLLVIIVGKDIQVDGSISDPRKVIDITGGEKFVVRKLRLGLGTISVRHSHLTGHVEIVCADAKNRCGMYLENAKLTVNDGANFTLEDGYIEMHGTELMETELSIQKDLHLHNGAIVSSGKVILEAFSISPGSILEVNLTSSDEVVFVAALEDAELPAGLHDGANLNISGFLSSKVFVAASEEKFVFGRKEASLTTLTNGIIIIDTLNVVIKVDGKIKLQQCSLEIKANSRIEIGSNGTLTLFKAALRIEESSAIEIRAGTLNITGGPLKIGEHSSIEIGDGSLNITGGPLKIGENSAITIGSGLLNMVKGPLEIKKNSMITIGNGSLNMVERPLEIGKNSALKIDSGTIKANKSSLKIGKDSSIEISSGSLITSGGSLKIEKDSAINISSGSLTTKTDLIIRERSSIEIGSGALEMNKGQLKLQDEALIEIDEGQMNIASDGLSLGQNCSIKAGNGTLIVEGGRLQLKDSSSISLENGTSLSLQLAEEKYLRLESSTIHVVETDSVKNQLTFYEMDFKPNIVFQNASLVVSNCSQGLRNESLEYKSEFDDNNQLELYLRGPQSCKENKEIRFEHP